MRSDRLAVAVLVGSLAAFGAGCALDVELTSTPDTVRSGEAVTFNIKVTNRSACPINPAGAELQAFIPVQSFAAGLFGSELPGDAPPEFQMFIDMLLSFFDELCAGGTPALPETPSGMMTSCRRTSDAMLCDLSGPAPSGGSGQSFAFSTDRINCQIDAGLTTCHLRLPFVHRSNGVSASAALALNQLSCFSEGGSVAFCAFGIPPDMLEDLPGGEMATGQISLPAVGAGPVRNLLFAISDSPDDLGVCKGGSTAGAACERDEMDECPGGSCGEGICDGGTNDGLGCDVATQAVDCPGMGATCVVCEPDEPDPGLPIDCTTTYISPQAAPTMSPWGLVATAVALMAAGSLWLRRRAARRH